MKSSKLQITIMKGLSIFLTLIMLAQVFPLKIFAQRNSGTPVKMDLDSFNFLLNTASKDKQEDSQDRMSAEEFNVDFLDPDSGKKSPEPEKSLQYSEERQNESIVKKTLSLATSEKDPSASNTVEPKAALTSGDFTYSVLSDNTARIDGYTGSSTQVTVPETLGGHTVKSIGPNAFYQNESIIKISLSSKIDRIGKNAFLGCTGLISVLLPPELKYIESSAFFNCTSLTELKLPNSVTSIESMAFALCTSLVKINYPNSWSSVPDEGGKIFYGCPIKAMTIPEGVKKIPDFAFRDCSNFTSFSLPTTLVEIGESSFSYCTELSSINLPNKLTKINASAFSFCAKLISVIIPNSVSTMGDYVFYDCDILNKVTIPISVSSIGMFAFDNCPNLIIYGYVGSYAAIYANENSISFSAIEGVPISFDLDKNINNSGVSKRSISVYWNDDFFRNSSDIYNHNLATACMALSATVGNKSYIKSALEQLGFGEIPDKDFHNYKDYDGSGDHVGYVFAHKQIKIGESTYELYAIIIRGTTGKEWYSDFSIGTSTDHEGFRNAADELLSDFNTYISIHKSSNQNIIFTTGHSRGAAISNLVAKALTDSPKPPLTLKWAPKERIFAYTFATPNVSQDANVVVGTYKTESNEVKEIKRKDLYTNIYNLIHYDDFVPVMPLEISGWGYGRYGKTYEFPRFEEPSMSKKLLSITGETFWGWESHYAINNFKRDLWILSPNTNYYYHQRYEMFPWYGLFKKDLTTPEEYFCKLAAIISGDNADIINFALSTSERNILNVAPISRFLIIGYKLTPLLAFSHAPETYISWMESLPYDWITKNYPNAHQKAVIACPVDVSIYDSSGRLVGRVVDNVIDETIFNPVSITLTGPDNDIKEIILPLGKEYNIIFSGTDSGTMSYSVEIFDETTNEIISQQNYSNIALEKDKKFIGSVQSDYIAETPTIDVNLVTLSDDGASNVTQTGEETPTNQVAIIAQPEKNGTVTGEGIYENGTNVDITATPDEGYVFIGWYENDALISTNQTLYFTATTNRVLKAVFAHETLTVSKIQSVNGSYTVLVNGVETDTAVTGDTVSIVMQPDTGYILSSLNVYNLDEPGIINTNENSFIMPPNPVAVEVNYVSDCWQYTSDSENNTVTILGYTGPGGEVTVPSAINNFPVIGIGQSAFSDCNTLITVTIPGCVTSISTDAFLNCDSLTSFEVSEANPNYCSEGGVLLNKAKTALIKYPNGNNTATKFIIPAGVTEIGDNAFSGCQSLQTIIIGNSLVSIGSKAFSGCTALKSATFGADVSQIASDSFENCIALEYAYFSGNAPTCDSSVFSDAIIDFKIYYRSGTTGWDNPTWNGKAIGIVPGDLTGDGKFNMTDAVAFVQRLAQGGYAQYTDREFVSVDIVRDGAANMSDIVKMALANSSIVLY